MPHRFGLKGKPDALVRTKSGAVIPVKGKRTIAPPRGPNDSNLIQTIAYGIPVEDRDGQPPPYVRVQIEDRWFDQLYTEAVAPYELFNHGQHLVFYPHPRLHQVERKYAHLVAVNDV